MKKEKQYVLTGYRASGIDLYTPKKNKKKVAMLLGLFLIMPDVIALTTIAAINKVNPVA